MRKSACCECLIRATVGTVARATRQQSDRSISVKWSITMSKRYRSKRKNVAGRAAKTKSVTVCRPVSEETISLGNEAGIYAQAILTETSAGVFTLTPIFLRGIFGGRLQPSPYAGRPIAIAERIRDRRDACAVFKSWTMPRKCQLPRLTFARTSISRKHRPKLCLTACSIGLVPADRQPDRLALTVRCAASTSRTCISTR